jgi:sulfite exporter TauE/SafE
MILIYQGLLAAGWLPKSGVAGRTSCLAGSLFASLLVGPGWLQVFLAGVFTGLLPCGLLYGMVALAGSTHAMLPAMAVMLVFGLGTAPLMILAGLGGSLMRLSWRRPLFRLAACCLILTGCISLARGASFLLAPTPTEACPFCAK